ncbi:hypothetical protein [Klebsiella quasipneumoniae]|nr:hypothetical protein [Klebsiella quasipneumoniae]
MGSNNAGKSSVLKAIEWLLSDKKNGLRLFLF